MDALNALMLTVAALIGGFVAMPLLMVGDRLLATVPAEDAAPVTYRASSLDVKLTSNQLMPLTIAAPWRWGLRVLLVILCPVALWRASHPVMLFGPAQLPSAIAFTVLMACVAALTLIATLDGAAHLIFAEVIAPPVVIVLLVGVSEGQETWVPMVVSGLVAGGIFLLLYLVGRLIYGTEALGFGDVELAGAFGVIVGWPFVLTAIIIGLLLMAVVSVVLLVLRRMTLRTYMPIGTFLTLGALLALILFPLPWR